MFKLLRKYFLNKKIKRIKKNTISEGNKLVEKYNMETYRIISGEITNIKTDFYNGAFNINDRRMYAQKLPVCTHAAIIDYLKELSFNVNSIQIEFNRFGNKYNIEIEVYLKADNDLDNRFISFKERPQSIEVGEYFYNSLLKELKLIPIKVVPTQPSKTSKYINPKLLFDFNETNIESSKFYLECEKSLFKIIIGIFERQDIKNKLIDKKGFIENLYAINNTELNSELNKFKQLPLKIQQSVTVGLKIRLREYIS